MQYTGSAELCLLGLSKEEQRKKGLYTVDADDADDDPLKGIVFPFKDASVPWPLPKDDDDDDAHAARETFNPFAVFKKGSDQEKTPLTEENHKEYLSQISQQKPTPKRQPLRVRKGGICISSETLAERRVKIRKNRQEKLAAQGRCYTGSYLSPFCQCSKDAASGSKDAASGPKDAYRAWAASLLAHHHPDVIQIWLAYLHLIRQYHNNNIPRRQYLDAASGPKDAYEAASASFLAHYHRDVMDIWLAHHPHNRQHLDAASASPLGHHHPDVIAIWLAYHRQIRQSHCFDIDDYPVGASVRPVSPSMNFNDKAKLPMELANCAIHEYNAKECNVFKYEVLKIEKLNFSLQSSSYQYWMTVKVLNLTLATPIETFLVHAGIDFSHHDDRIIYCCRPKEAAIFGLPSCDVCFGKLRGEKEQLFMDVHRYLGICLHCEHSIPKAASTEHREEFLRIYGRYFHQCDQSDGFDLDVYPGCHPGGDEKAVPYLDFEKEADMLMELANHAIQDFNNGETSAYKYKVSYIEKVNFLMAEYCEFFMTVKAINLTLRTPLETFQIHAYKGPHGENVVRLCRKKVLI